MLKTYTQSCFWKDIFKNIYYYINAEMLLLKKKHNTNSYFWKYLKIVFTCKIISELLFLISLIIVFKIHIIFIWYVFAINFLKICISIFGFKYKLIHSSKLDRFLYFRAQIFQTLSNVNGKSITTIYLYTKLERYKRDFCVKIHLFKNKF